MPAIQPFLIKYGITLGKVIWAMATCDNKGALDNVLRTSDTILNETSKKRSVEIDVIFQSVLKALSDVPIWEGSQSEFEDAAAEASETLHTGFTFESIAENLNSPDSISLAWCSTRRHYLPPVGTGVRALHDDILRETASLLVPILPDMPGFRTWLVGYTARTFSALIHHAEAQSDAIKELAQLLRNVIGTSGMRDAEYENSYRDSLARRLDRVELFIERQDVAQESREQRLTVAYVTLELARDRTQESGREGVRADTLLDRLPPGPPHVLVVGRAGCGKTTLLRWLGLEAARCSVSAHTDDPYLTPVEPPYADKHSPSRWRDYVPFMVRLRDHTTGELPTVPTLPLYARCPLEAPDGWANQVLKSGRGMLLIDGLDELPPDRRLEALDWIRNLIAEFPNGNAIVASSRPEALPKRALSDARFIEYEVCELSPQGRIEFVYKWHAAVKQLYKHAPERCHELEAKQCRLLLELETNLSVALLASNPLLCALLCALNRVYTQALPENMRDLCESACKMLLWDRDQLSAGVKTGAPAQYVELNYEMRLLVARNLAFAIVTGHGSQLSRSAAIDEVDTALHGAVISNRSEAKAVLKGLIERSNLLREAGSNSVEFVHNSLRDYLASLRFVVRDDYEFLAKHLVTKELDRWEAIILFAAATNQTEMFGPNLLRTILPHEETAPRKRSRRTAAKSPGEIKRDLLALKVARQIRYRLPTDLDAQLKSIYTSFLPIDSVERATMLAEAGDAAVEHLGYCDGRDEMIAAACVRGLAQIGSTRAKKHLLEYLARDRRPRVLDVLGITLSPQEMSRSINILEIPFVLRGVCSPTEDRFIGGYRLHVKDLTPLASVGNIEVLYLSNTLVNNLVPLSKTTTLRELYVNGTQIDSLAPLARLLGLQVLYASNTSVSDVSPLANMHQLRGLHLHSTLVSDLTPIVGLRELQWLHVGDAELSSAKQNEFVMRRGFLGLPAIRISRAAPD